MNLNMKRNFSPQSHDIPKLFDKDKINYNNPSPKKMLTALKGMQNDKSPGIDGLPTKFYNSFGKT